MTEDQGQDSNGSSENDEGLDPDEVELTPPEEESETVDLTESQTGETASGNQEDADASEQEPSLSDDYVEKDDGRARSRETE